MKKVLAMIISVTMCFMVLAACGKEGKSNKKEDVSLNGTPEDIADWIKEDKDFAEILEIFDTNNESMEVQYKDTKDEKTKSFAIVNPVIVVLGTCDSDSKKILSMRVDYLIGDTVGEVMDSKTDGERLAVLSEGNLTKNMVKHLFDLSDDEVKEVKKYEPKVKYKRKGKNFYVLTGEADEFGDRSVTISTYENEEDYVKYIKEIGKK